MTPLQPRGTREVLTHDELVATQEVLERVKQIVGNNDPGWTGRYGLPLLKDAFTPAARSARDKLPPGPYRCLLRDGHA